MIAVCDTYQKKKKMIVVCVHSLGKKFKDVLDQG